mmetsp:Transcript_42687/g.65499  ORF Transcript_42687/g.65499 Transcript_42687/m.65499 type:complete len:111 (-) Transcript_42687:1420-1752(-)
MMPFKELVPAHYSLLSWLQRLEAFSKEFTGYLKDKTNRMITDDSVLNVSEHPKSVMSKTSQALSTKDVKHKWVFKVTLRSPYFMRRLPSQINLSPEQTPKPFYFFQVKGP